MQKRDHHRTTNQHAHRIAVANSLRLQWLADESSKLQRNDSSLQGRYPRTWKPRPSNPQHAHRTPRLMRLPLRLADLIQVQRPEQQRTCRKGITTNMPARLQLQIACDCSGLQMNRASCKETTLLFREDIIEHGSQDLRTRSTHTAHQD